MAPPTALLYNEVIVAPQPLAAALGNNRTFPFFFVWMCLLFLACRHDTRHTHPDTRTAFRYNQHNPITSLDPAFARTQNNIWAVANLYNTLIELDDSLHIRPALATHWSISADGCLYRFRLRDDVYFHDDPCFLPNGKGRRFVADDVVYSFRRLLDEKVASPGSWIFAGRVVTGDSAFVAEGDSVFILRLAQPFQPMLYILTMQYASVVPREAVEFYHDDFRIHPVGTGAFQFKIWAENQALVLLKNPHYFEKDEQGNRLPYLDAIKTTFITDRKTAFLDFKNGKLDYFFGLESSYIHELLTPEGELLPHLHRDFYLVKNPYLNTEYLGIRMNSDAAPTLQNRKIRQALNYGFDRHAMLRTLRNNVGQPANSGFTPRGLPTFDSEKVRGYTYDPARAARLLAEAGFPGGRGLPEITLLCPAEYLDVCTFVVRQWQDLGIRVRIELVENATLRERMRTGTASFFRASWIADYPDAESFLTCFYSGNGAPPNYTAFRNADFDRYYEQALRTPQPAVRAQLYQKMEQILVDEAPVVFLFYDETAQFAHRSVQNLPRNAINLLQLKSVKKVK